jgi:two-component system CheB/CheR fusion protein
VYPESIEADVSPERLRRFFTKDERTYRIQKQIRDMCVFARQNITVDPPFSRVDLVTCRNVLIYMSPPLQDRLLPVFHFALNSGGFLVLGLAETVGSFADLFELVDGTQKIYRRRDAAQRAPLSFMSEPWISGSVTRRHGPSAAPVNDPNREADRIILERYAPPSVLVNHDFEIQQFRGRTAPYLEAPSGQPTTNILRMARDGLFMELHSSLNEAKATRSPVTRDNLRVPSAVGDIEFTLRVLPVNASQPQDFNLLVLFEPKDLTVWSAAIAAPEPPASNGTERDIAWLRQELVASKQYLQSVVDQQEAASQELRAAHEEVLSKQRRASEHQRGTREPDAS